MSITTLNDEQKQFLLRMARESAQVELEGRKADHAKYSAKAKELGLDCHCGGCFVTYKNHGELRGCIGVFTPDDPLYEVVLSRGSASLSDSRFTWQPITLSEFKKDINITISILTPPVPITDPLKEVKVGVHGIVVSKGYLRGTYLPQVAVEQNWDVKTFLTHCANRKAGITGDVLRDPAVHWETYTALLAHE
eukprot:TRINITY_DN532_c0_g1_i5.p1 TRINITY_DN532_c0_g1~~TRINITY_DN532_c0_g1_i5.p1  ORF type:complete len:193 (+),score=68.92 TRINITY_DN532_c0_g1_i5:93-671(+)